MINKLVAPFRGATAALAQRKRAVVYFGLVSLAMALIGGALARFSVRPVDVLGAIQLLAAWGLVLASPLVASFGLTVQNNRDTAISRLTEISCLPLGPLALPASVFLLSGIVLAWSSLLTVLGLAVTAGGEDTTLAIGELLAEREAGWHCALLGAAWLYFTSLACIGRQPAIFSAIWAWLPVCLTPYVSRMGYSHEETQSYAVLWFLCMGAYYLALPFVLYAQPRHHWFSSWKLRRTRFEMVSGLTAFLGLLFFALFSWGRAVAFIGLLGGGILGLMRWGMPPRRRSDSSLMRVSYLLAMAAMLPPIAYGLWADYQAHRPRSIRDIVDPQVLSVAPKGRAFLAYGYDSQEDQRYFTFLVRDPERSREVVSLPLRFGGAGHSWSRDGRYLAVTYGDFGRMAAYSVPSQVTVSASALSNLSRDLFTPERRALVIDLRSGEQSQLEDVLVSDGWAHPDELLRATTELDGRIVLSDRRGRREVLKTNDFIEVERYTAEGPVLKRNGGRFLWRENRYELLDSLVYTTSYDASLIIRKFDRETREVRASLCLDDNPDPKQRKLLPLVNDRSRWVQRPADAPAVATEDEGIVSLPRPYILVFTEEGLVRFDQDSRELKTIIAGDARGMRFLDYSVLQQRDLPIAVGDQVYWIDTRSWETSVAEFPEGFLPVTRLEGAVLGIADSRWSWLEDGKARALWEQDNPSIQEYLESKKRREASR